MVPFLPGLLFCFTWSLRSFNSESLYNKGKKDSITRGKEQTITVNIIDKDSKEEVSGIEINGFIRMLLKLLQSLFLE